MISIKVLQRERGEPLPKKVMDDNFIQIEETQAALRDSIERARELVEETERLVLKHRAEAAKPPNPQSGGA